MIDALPWRSPCKIKFTQDDIIWLIQMLWLLQQGVWPPDPTGYTAQPSKPRYARAKFETPILFSAEIKRRLEHCGEDGKITKDYYSENDTVYELARYHHTTVDEIERRCKSCLYQISGWNFYPEKRYYRLPADSWVYAIGDRQKNSG